MTVINVTVLPDNDTVQATVITAKRASGKLEQISKNVRNLARSQFEALRAAVLNAALPSAELSAPSPVQPNELWVCSDGPLVAIEVALNHPTPIFVRREAGCLQPDPVLVAAKLVERFAGIRGL